MVELDKLRSAVRERRRAVGRSQRQLAAAVGLHPDVLSHKLNGHGRALLSLPEAANIILTLASWGAFDDRTAVDQAFRWAGIPVAGPAGPRWDEPPLSLLPGAKATGPEAVSARALSGVDGRLTAVQLGRLPAAPTALIGRQRQRDLVAEALQSSRLVTLTGVGGTGKTRLAVQVAADVAESYPDGVGFVDLSSLRDHALLSTVLASACGITAAAAEEAEEKLIDALDGRQILLLVDNVEQVVEGADVLGRVLAATPGVRILATSRVPLRLYGEHVLRVPPLRLLDEHDQHPERSEAVALFVERASAAGSVEARSDLDVVAQICGAVDGLPLAIELAAAATRRYSPRELLPRIRSGVGVLRDGPRDVPSRHRTLQATLDWSYDLLSEPAQRLLSHLSVFAGRFGLDDAAAVSASPSEDELTDLLAELGDHSMIESTAAGAAPFALLQTVREYASMRLAGCDDDAVQQRNLAHHLQRAESAGRLSGPERVSALAALKAIYPNIRVALDHAIRRGRDDTTILEQGFRLATAVAPVWLYSAPVAEGLLYLQRLLAVECDDLDLDLGANAEMWLCAFACFSGDYDLASTYSRRSVHHFELIGDPVGVARSLRYDGESEYARGNLSAAGALFRRALAVARRAGDCEGHGHASNMLGQLLLHQGRLEEAGDQLSEAIAAFACSDFTTGVGCATQSLAEVLRSRGRADEAAELLRVALRIADLTSDVRSFAYVFESFAVLHADRDKHVQVVRLLAAAAGVRERLGARLAPVDQALLERGTARSVEAVDPVTRRAEQRRGRALPTAEVVRSLLEHETDPIIATGDAEDLLAWVDGYLATSTDARLRDDLRLQHSRHESRTFRSSPMRTELLRSVG